MTLENAVLNKLSLKMQFRQTVIGKHAILVKRHWKRGTKSYNYDKTGANFCHQVAALVPNIFCKFCLQKIMKLLITLQLLKLEKTISADTERLNFQKFLVHVTLNLKSIKIYLVYSLVVARNQRLILLSIFWLVLNLV